MCDIFVHNLHMYMLIVLDFVTHFLYFAQHKEIFDKMDFMIYNHSPSVNINRLSRL